MACAFKVALNTEKNSIKNGGDSKIESLHYIKNRLEIYNIVDAHIYYQRICIRIMYENKWIDGKKYKYSNELLSEIGRILGGLIKSLGVSKNA